MSRNSITILVPYLEKGEFDQRPNSLKLECKMKYCGIA